MKIELKFAELKIGDQKYNKDVIIFYDGRVLKRPKELSKPKSDLYNHTPFSVEEAKEVKRILGNKVDKLIIGNGLYGRMIVEKGVKELFDTSNIGVEVYESKEAIERFLTLVEKGERVALLLHLTC